MTDWTDGPARVLLGEALKRLRELPAESVDALVTDPPAGISFMGRAWDTFPTRERPAGYAFADGRARPGVAGGQEHDPRMRRPFIAFLTEVAAECLRVLKPGAHGLVWAIPRTSHWTATALEDAGFEVRDVVHHLQGGGFPKSKSMADIGRPELGTALKPATEHWILVRKPLAERNVAANVLAHGAGALNIDACRVGTTKDVPGGLSRTAGSSLSGSADGSLRHETGTEGGHDPHLGRWPANLVLSHAEGCVPVGTRRVRNHDLREGRQGRRLGGFGNVGAGKGSALPNGPLYGEETVEAWECVQGCPVAELDRQSGVHEGGHYPIRTSGMGYGGGNGTEGGSDRRDAPGGASRFFYVAKASARERSAGLPPGQRNVHPTVKPIALMRWLCRLVTPAGGLVLDPFMGSGTTGVAAILEGFGFIGIEQDPESMRTAIARLQHWRHEPDLLEAR